MEPSTKVFGKTDYSKVRETKNGKTELPLKASILMARRMVAAYLSGLMDVSMQAYFKTTN